MRIHARSVLRPLLVAVVALAAAVALGLTTTITSALTLVVTYALIVPGTGTPNPAAVQNYMENAVGHYLVPGGDCGAGGGCEPPIAVPYIAQFWPIPLPGWGGLDGAKWNVSVRSGVDRLVSTYADVTTAHPTDDISIFGYSQGATVSSIVKGNLGDLSQANKDRLNFFFIGNPQRPNGGIFERLAALGTVPILDATFGNPTPTDTCEHSDGSHCATDFALQYDGVADFPEFPLNPLATANALAGFWYVHGTYLAPDDDEPPTATPYGYSPAEIADAIAAANEVGGCTAANHCQRHGDTIYLTLPARTLPLMQPVLDLGAATGTTALIDPVVDLISPMAQTLIETGYDRTDYGKPSPFGLIPRIDPVKLAGDLAGDIPEGIHAALDPGPTPLPGSTATPTVTVQVPDDTDTASTEDDGAVSTAARTPAAKPDHKPLVRLSPIARPHRGLSAPADDDATAETAKAKPPSLRKALGIKGHPVRDLAKSLTGPVRKALGQDSEPAAQPVNRHAGTRKRRRSGA
ncbi:PE-PPE domain-containing protein [Mycobacterium sp. NPDC003449]